MPLPTIEQYIQQSPNLEYRAALECWDNVLSMCADAQLDVCHPMLMGINSWRNVIPPDLPPDPGLWFAGLKHEQQRIALNAFLSHEEECKALLPTQTATIEKWLLAMQHMDQPLAVRFAEALKEDGRVRRECWREICNVFLEPGITFPEIERRLTKQVLLDHVEHTLHGPRVAVNLDGFTFGHADRNGVILAVLEPAFLRPSDELERLLETPLSLEPLRGLGKRFDRKVFFFATSEKGESPFVALNTVESIINRLALAHPCVPMKNPIHFFVLFEVRLPKDAPGVPTIIEGCQWKLGLFYPTPIGQSFGRTKPADSGLDGVPEVVTHANQVLPFGDIIISSPRIVRRGS